MRHRATPLVLAALGLVAARGASRRAAGAGHGHPPARAPAAGLPAGGVGEPERRLGLPVRPRRLGRARALVRGRTRELPADHPRPLLLGLEALGGPGRGGCRLVRAHRPGARGLEGQARLPRGRRFRLEDERVAGRRADRRLPGRLHALRAGPDEGGEARARPGARPPRRRHTAPVQARGQAGLRQGARAVADRLPRGAPRPPPGVGRVPPRPGPEAGRGAGEALGKGVRGSGRGALGPDRRPRRPLRLGGAGARRGRRARGPPDPAARGAPAPVVARGPAPLRRHAHAHRREGRGPRELVLRPPEARGREARPASATRTCRSTENPSTSR